MENLTSHVACISLFSAIFLVLPIQRNKQSIKVESDVPFGLKNAIQSVLLGTKFGVLKQMHIGEQVKHQDRQTSWYKF